MQVVSETKASGLLDSVSQAGDGTWSLATSDRDQSQIHFLKPGTGVELLKKKLRKNTNLLPRAIVS